MTDYATLGEVKARLSSDDKNMSAKWDAVLTNIIGAVSRTFDRTMGQKRGARGQFSIVADATASARSYSRRGSRSSYLPIDDCISITTVTSTGCADLGATGWTADRGSPTVGIFRELGAWPDGNGVIVVAARWGMFEDLPEDLRDQVIIECLRSYQGARAGYDDKIGVTPFGTVQIAKAFSDSTRRMLNDYGYGGGFMRAGG